MLTPVIVGPQFSCRLDQAPPSLLPPSLANKRFTTSDITAHNTDTINTKGIITTSVDTRNCEPLGKKKEPRDWGGGYFWVFIMAADQIRGERCQIRRSPFSASGDSAGCHLGTKVLLPPIFFLLFHRNRPVNLTKCWVTTERSGHIQYIQPRTCNRRSNQISNEELFRYYNCGD